ncbi:MAG: pyridoxamine 5'-phosphate oxidase family protein [Deltaproteobacteria bacterium]|nr:pyridoxamine 5'-phosphate oxidase family protein [Deltaproteobacteria bacterium]
MTKDELVTFLRGYKLAVEATTSRAGSPQAAVVGFAVSDQLELIFDTLESTRKYENLRADPRIAMVVGWDHEITVQLEGVADFPVGEELERIRQVYFVPYPDGRDRLSWPGITHVRVRPSWVRFSDFTVDPPKIVELSTPELGESP